MKPLFPTVVIETPNCWKRLAVVSAKPQQTPAVIVTFLSIGFFFSAGVRALITAITGISATQPKMLLADVNVKAPILSEPADCDTKPIPQTTAVSNKSKLLRNFTKLIIR